MISKWVKKANAMLPAPGRPEIDEGTTKFAVGVIAIGLPILTSTFAQEKLTSISAAYYEEGWSQGTFIGFLFEIAAFPGGAIRLSHPAQCAGNTWGRWRSKPTTARA
jgi:hypothetical protein